MHEHGGEDGRDGAGRVLGEAPRNEGPLLDEGLASAQLDEEEQHVERNERIGHNGQRSARRVVVADRKHWCPPLFAALSLAMSHRCRAGRTARCGETALVERETGTGVALRVAS